MSSSLKEQLLQKGLITPEQAQSIEQKSQRMSSKTSASSESRPSGSSRSKDGNTTTPNTTKHSDTASKSPGSSARRQPRESAPASESESREPGRHSIDWPGFLQDFRVPIPVKGERRWYVEAQDGRIFYVTISETCAEWLERGQAAIVESPQGGHRIINQEGAHQLQHTAPHLIRFWNHTILSETTPHPHTIP